jgi:hypothetical protein
MRCWFSRCRLPSLIGWSGCGATFATAATGPASAPNFKDWQSQQTVFEQLAALELWAFNNPQSKDGL